MDLDQASVLDPQGDSHEMRELASRARGKLESYDAKPLRR
jgi:hypothetical protein